LTDRLGLSSISTEKWSGYLTN